MMSLGEWITVVSVVGVVGATILAAFIYLIYILRKEAVNAAIAKKEAEDNAIAVHKLEEAAEILIEPLSVDDTIRKLRDGKF